MMDDTVPDETTALDACMAWLNTDAAELHRNDPEDEIANNMLKAESLMREMMSMLTEVSANFTRDDDLPDNLLGRIHSILYRN